MNGDTGIMGGSKSHEYHYSTGVGEDTLLQCEKCGQATNKELLSEGEVESCPNCGDGNLITSNGIEIGHTFLLGDKYSKVLGATALLTNGKTSPLVMGCYGIGVSRLLAASVEKLSTETSIQWPYLLAPFKVCLIPPKEGSKEASKITSESIDDLYWKLNALPGFNDEILVDDRSQMTIGKRLFDAKRMGYPLVIVVGSKATETEPEFELHSDDLEAVLSFNEICETLINFKGNK